jgi:hypothetical protein
MKTALKGSLICLVILATGLSLPLFLAKVGYGVYHHEHFGTFVLALAIFLAVPYLLSLMLVFGAASVGIARDLREVASVIQHYRNSRIRFFYLASH